MKIHNQGSLAGQSLLLHMQKLYLEINKAASAVPPEGSPCGPAAQLSQLSPVLTGAVQFDRRKAKLFRNIRVLDL